MPPFNWTATRSSNQQRKAPAQRGMRRRAEPRQRSVAGSKTTARRSLDLVSLSSQSLSAAHAEGAFAEPASAAGEAPFPFRVSTTSQPARRVAQPQLAASAQTHLMGPHSQHKTPDNPALLLCGNARLTCQQSSGTAAWGALQPIETISESAMSPVADAFEDDCMEADPLPLNLDAAEEVDAEVCAQSAASALPGEEPLSSPVMNLFRVPKSDEHSVKLNVERRAANPRVLVVEQAERASSLPHNSAADYKGVSLSACKSSWASAPLQNREHLLFNSPSANRARTLNSARSETHPVPTHGAALDLFTLQQDPRFVVQQVSLSRPPEADPPHQLDLYNPGRLAQPAQQSHQAVPQRSGAVSLCWPPQPQLRVAAPADSVHDVSDGRMQSIGDGCAGLGFDALMSETCASRLGLPCGEWESPYPPLPEFGLQRLLEQQGMQLSDVRLSDLDASPFLRQGPISMPPILPTADLSVPARLPWPNPSSRNSQCELQPAHRTSISGELPICATGAARPTSAAAAENPTNGAVAATLMPGELRPPGSGLLAPEPAGRRSGSPPTIGRANYDSAYASEQQRARRLSISDGGVSAAGEGIDAAKIIGGCRLSTSEATERQRVSAWTPCAQRMEDVGLHLEPTNCVLSQPELRALDPHAARHSKSTHPPTLGLSMAPQQAEKTSPPSPVPIPAATMQVDPAPLIVAQQRQGCRGQAIGEASQQEQLRVDAAAYTVQTEQFENAASRWQGSSPPKTARQHAALIHEASSADRGQRQSAVDDYRVECAEIEQYGSFIRCSSAPVDGGHTGETGAEKPNSAPTPSTAISAGSIRGHSAAEGYVAGTLPRSESERSSDAFQQQAAGMAATMNTLNENPRKRMFDAFTQTDHTLWRGKDAASQVSPT